MNKFIYAFVLVSLSAAVKVNAIQCYECYNCTKVTDSDLTTCGATTTTSSTGTPGTTTPGTGTPATSTPSTGTPATSTPSTGTPATSTPSTGTPATTTPSTGTPATSTPSQTDTPETNPTQPGTVGSGTGETGTGQSNNAPISGSNLSVTRVRRAADEVQVKADKYVCGSTTEKVNDVDVVIRGCLLDSGDGNTCQNYNMSTACKTCDTDKCNSAVSLQFSVMMLLFVFFWSFA